jgi:putative membrane protein
MPEEQHDPRYFLAAERTFLAWIRTGLALMGFGFVVARFGLFLKEVQATADAPFMHSTGFSVGLGTTLVLVGVAINIIAAIQHVHIVRRIRLGEALDRPSHLAMAISITLAVAGVAMAVYLLSVH